MALILGLLICLTGCNSPRPLSHDPLRIAFIKDPSTLDPKKAHDLASTSICFMLYEGLFRSSEKGDLEFGICDGVEVSKDKKTYLFKLKKTYWSDGSMLSAYDFQNTWLDQLHPDFPSPYSYLFYSIKNAKDYKTNRCSKADVGIKAINHHLLQITLESPRDDLLHLLSFSSFFPAKQIGKHLLSNGPFKLVKHLPHLEMRLEKNPHYHDAKHVDIEKIQIKIIDSEPTALAMYRQGQLDLIGGPLSGIPFEETISQKPHFTKYMAGATLCAFNTQSKYFQNINLRKAFALSVDYEAIKKACFGNDPSVIHFLPSNKPYKIPKTVPSHDPNQAKHCLEQALSELHISKKDLENLTYYFGAKPEHSKLAQILQASWKKTLGIDIKLCKLEHKILSSKINNKDFDFAQLVWLSPYDSPLALVERFKEEKLAKNFTGFTSDLLKSMIAKLEAGQGKQEELIENIENIFSQNIPFIPISMWQYPYYASPKIKRLCFTNLGTINYTFVKINKDSCSLPPSSGI